MRLSNVTDRHPNFRHPNVQTLVKCQPIFCQPNLSPQTSVTQTSVAQTSIHRTFFSHQKVPKFPQFFYSKPLLKIVCPNLISVFIHLPLISSPTLSVIGSSSTRTNSTSFAQTFCQLNIIPSQAVFSFHFCYVIFFLIVPTLT